MLDYQNEFYMLMKSCEKLEYDDINCYVLKTLYNLTKSLKQNRFEIILESYSDFLKYFEHIKNNYKHEKSSFKTYIYFYIRKYLRDKIAVYNKKFENEVNSLLFDDKQYDDLLESYYEENQDFV